MKSCAKRQLPPASKRLERIHGPARHKNSVTVCHSVLSKRIKTPKQTRQETDRPIWYTTIQKIQQATRIYNKLQQAWNHVTSLQDLSNKMVNHLLWVLPTGLKMFRGQTGSTIHLRHGLVWSPPQRLWNFNAWSLKHHLGTMFHDRGNNNAKQRRIFSNNTKPLLPITSLSRSPSMSLDWMQILRCYFILAQT